MRIGKGKEDLGWCEGLRRLAVKEAYWGKGMHGLSGC